MVAVDNLVVKGGNVLALPDVVLDGLVFHIPQVSLDVGRILSQVDAASECLLYHGVLQIRLNVRVGLFEEVVLVGERQHDEQPVKLGGSPDVCCLCSSCSLLLCLLWPLVLADERSVLHQLLKSCRAE